MPSRSAALYLAAIATVMTGAPSLAQTRSAAPAVTRPAPARPAPPAAGDGPPLARTTFLSDMNQQFLKMDADKNGQITLEEAAAFERMEAMTTAAARNRALFQSLDTDRNGSLSADEFRRLMQPVQATGQRFIRGNDPNRDGRVTLIDYRTTTLANFDKLDTDKDGFVSPAEMRAAGIGAR
jgi:Ca2+-binding EF-hand superfamily protein